MRYRVIRLERHELGPRIHVAGRRVHEYHAGFLALLGAPLVWFVTADASVWAGTIALLGAWLVVKDWPDLFPATRDRASWRLGIHRLESNTGEADT